MLDTFMRRNIAAVAQVVEMCDTGQQLPRFEPGEFPDELEEQDPDYLSSVRALIVGRSRSEPLLVGPPFQYHVGQLVTTSAHGGTQALGLKCVLCLTTWR